MKLRQEMFVEMIGRARARMSFFMNQFRRLGYIDHDGEVHVRRSLLNALILYWQSVAKVLQ